MAKAVIFDLDGAVADTQRFIAQIESDILSGLGVTITPGRCVVIGDAEADAEAAHRAGMKCIKLTPGSFDLHPTAHAVPSLCNITPGLIRSM